MIQYRIGLKFCGLNFRCFRGYNGFRKNYLTKISNAHERAPILSSTVKFKSHGI